MLYALLIVALSLFSIHIMKLIKTFSFLNSNENFSLLLTLNTALSLGNRLFPDSSATVNYCHYYF